MRYIFHKQPDIAHEAHSALRALYQGETIEKWRDGVLEAYPGDELREAIDLLCTDLIALEKEIAAAVDLRGESAALLYIAREKLSAFCDAPRIYRLMEAAGMEGDALYSIFGGLPLGLMDEADEAPTDTASFARWVEALDASPADKYDALRLYMDFPAYLARYDRDIALARAVIERRLPAFSPRIEAAAEELERSFPALQARLGFQMRDGETYDIYPSLLGPSGISMTCEDRLGINDLHVGIELPRTVAMLDVARQKQDVPAEFLKLLADPTKLRILRILGQRDHYSAELAEALELSGATISHHMSLLLSKGLVSMEKAGNRIYYSIQKEAIRQRLRRVERALCGEEGNDI